MRPFRLLLAAALLPALAAAQMDGGGAMGGMKHEASTPSATLTITGLHGEAKTLSPAEMKAMPHETVTVTNSHSHQQESYSGVPVKTLLALVSGQDASDAMQARRSQRMTIVTAEGTDKFRIALTFCDTDPACRSGQAIVADSLNNQPLTTDGAFKLILTEDKTPGRWVRNLNALTEKNLGSL